MRDRSQLRLLITLAALVCAAAACAPRGGTPPARQRPALRATDVAVTFVSVPQKPNHCFDDAKKQYVACPDTGWEKKCWVRLFSFRKSTLFSGMAARYPCPKNVSVTKLAEKARQTIQRVPDRDLPHWSARILRMCTQGVDQVARHIWCGPGFTANKRFFTRPDSALDPGGKK